MGALLVVMALFLLGLWLWPDGLILLLAGGVVLCLLDTWREAGRRRRWNGRRWVYYD
jgi:hypothetical protein